jgi:hypothetical protein
MNDAKSSLIKKQRQSIDQLVVQRNYRGFNHPQKPEGILLGRIQEIQDGYPGKNN